MYIIVRGDFDVILGAVLCFHANYVFLGSYTGFIIHHYDYSQYVCRDVASLDHVHDRTTSKMLPTPING